MIAQSSDIVLQCRDVGHSFGSKRVLNQVNLSIGRGQIVGLVGPSGSGKSTLLRAILGTHPAGQGQTLMEGKPYSRPSRDRGIVYQKYSLYPFLSCLDNVAFGLKLDQTSTPFRFFNFPAWRRVRERHRQQAHELLDQVGLASVSDMYPEQLSGGMRQRVAIAQALIMQPKLLLLDEPFGALDEATREDLQLMLLRLYEKNVQARAAGQVPPYTILIVTHELNEAIYVSDRILGLSQYHQDGDRGATIVYDKAAPVYNPNSPKDNTLFAAQREELLTAVFDSEMIQHHTQYVSFWNEHASASQPQ